MARRKLSPAEAGAIMAVVVLVLVLFTLWARRQGYKGLGGDTVVRCRDGHLFTTIWIPGASVKSIKLGWSRYQYCPVGKHWTLVTPVKVTELSEDELQGAAAHHDVRVP
ncbi:MAG TPA: hypothetical protein VK277_17120 [Acidimicrobiales bacterium]|nr:hypothetical protein [Acidimicrobiales bacterium]